MKPSCICWEHRLEKDDFDVLGAIPIIVYDDWIHYLDTDKKVCALEVWSVYWSYCPYCGTKATNNTQKVKELRPRRSLRFCPVCKGKGCKGCGNKGTLDDYVQYTICHNVKILIQKGEKQLRVGLNEYFTVYEPSGWRMVNK